MLDSASERAKKLGVLRNSFTKGKGNLIGFLGEEIVIAAGAKRLNTYDYDVILPNMKTADVKTQRCLLVPTSGSGCFIFRKAIKQKCQYYVFVRMHSSLKYGWILGKITKLKFFALAKVFKKGQKYPFTGRKVRVGCYGIPASLLEKF